MKRKIENLVCYNFYAGWREISSMCKSLTGDNTSLQRLFISDYLVLNKTTTVGDLAKHLNLVKCAVSTLLSRMEDEKLIRRYHNYEKGGDRRVVYVELTSKGIASQKKHSNKINEITSVIDESITEEEKNILLKITEKVSTNRKNQKIKVLN